MLSLILPAAMASHDIRAWVYFERFRGMYDAGTENKVAHQRSQRSRSPRVFPRLNAEPLAEPVDVDSESSSDGTAYLHSDVDSMGDGLGFPQEFAPPAAATDTGSAPGTAGASPSVPSVSFSRPVTFNAPVTFVNAVNFSSASGGGMSAASSSAQRIDQSPPPVD